MAADEGAVAAVHNAVAGYTLGLAVAVFTLGLFGRGIAGVVLQVAGVALLGVSAVRLGVRLRARTGPTAWEDPPPGR